MIQDSGETRRENATSWIRHCEERKRRSNPEPQAWLWIASLMLAMTHPASSRRRPGPNHRAWLLRRRPPPSATDGLRGTGPGLRRDDGGVCGSLLNDATQGVISAVEQRANYH